MALEIVWTKKAELGYDKVVDYLETHFTDVEVENFVRKSNEFFKLLSEYPKLLQSGGKRKNLHRGPINKYTILTYRVKPRKKQIELINIRSSRQEPLNR